MSSKFAQDILSDTIRHLEQEKVRGTRFIHMDAELWKELGNIPEAPRTVSFQAENSKATLTASSDFKDTDRRAAWEALRTKALACQKCPHLVSFRKQVVFGVGNVNAELMFVGEAPGADEDKQGEPFVGRAGQLLTKMIQAMGLNRSDIYIANVLKCRPNVDTPTGNRKPTPEEMETCVSYLKEQIQLIRPRVLVAVGDTAVKGLLPDLKQGITKLRGNWLEFESIPLMPTFHPSYLLHNQSLALKRLCWEDLLSVMEKLQKPISEKQRNYFLSAISGKTTE